MKTYREFFISLGGGGDDQTNKKGRKKKSDHAER